MQRARQCSDRRAEPDNVSPARSIFARALRFSDICASPVTSLPGNLKFDRVPQICVSLPAIGEFFLSVSRPAALFLPVEDAMSACR